MNVLLWSFFALITAIAAITDYRHEKIYNWLTLPSILIAFIFAGSQNMPAFTQALMGFAIASVIFLPLYVMKVFGGGDVKMMMALGALLGPKQTLDFVFVCFLILGFGSLVLLIKQKRVFPFLKQLGLFFRSLFVKELEVQFPVLSKQSRAPFGVVIFLAYLSVFADYLKNTI